MQAFRGEFEKPIRQSVLVIELNNSVPIAWWQLRREFVEEGSGRRSTDLPKAGASD